MKFKLPFYKSHFELTLEDNLVNGVLVSQT